METACQQEVSQACSKAEGSERKAKQLLDQVRLPLSSWLPCFPIVQPQNLLLMLFMCFSVKSDAPADEKND